MLGIVPLLISERDSVGSASRCFQPCMPQGRCWRHVIGRESIASVQLFGRGGVDASVDSLRWLPLCNNGGALAAKSRVVVVLSLSKH